MSWYAHLSTHTQNKSNVVIFKTRRPIYLAVTPLFPPFPPFCCFSVSIEPILERPDILWPFATGCTHQAECSICALNLLQPLPPLCPWSLLTCLAWIVGLRVQIHWREGQSYHEVAVDKESEAPWGFVASRMLLCQWPGMFEYGSNKRKARGWK